VELSADGSQSTRVPDSSYIRFKYSLKTFYLVSGTKARCESAPFNSTLEILLFTYLQISACKGRA